MTIRFLVPVAIAILFTPLFSSANSHPDVAYVPTCPNLYRNLSLGSRGQDVVELQNFLISQGDLAAGYNTGYFGSLTQAAVQSFQRRHNIASSGTPSTTGYGAVGPRTRAKILQICSGQTYAQAGYYSQGSYAPFSASPTSGGAPLAVNFTSNVGGTVAFGDGTSGAMSEAATGASGGPTFKAYHTYATAGAYTAQLSQHIGGPSGPEQLIGTVTITVAGAVTNLSCTSDSQCPSSNYRCEAISGYGTACAYTSSGQLVDPNCSSTQVITQGVCKVKEGKSCSTSTDCVSGTLCHMNVCTNPVGKACNGASEASAETLCGVGWQCVQDCGGPVSNQYDPPPGYHCMLNELANKPRQCPQCLAGSTLIDTPAGKVAAKDVRTGMTVWTTDSALNRIAGVVIGTSKVPVSNHSVVHLVLSDGRDVHVSAGHPTADGRTVGDLKSGDAYDGAAVMSAEQVAYDEEATYDLLPSGDVGHYWADGILLGSTLK